MREAVITEAMIAARVRDRLQQEYRGVFPDDLRAYEQALDERLALTQSEDQLTYVRDITANQSGVRVLDLGCGYGTFVLTCLRHGYDARGIDVAEFELEIARTRLRSAGSPADPEVVFQAGDGARTHFQDRAFDVITCWNLLEHVPRYTEVLREADRLVRPGGFVFITAPNYCAFRREAHYQVPWIPLMPKSFAVWYLRALRRNPTFLWNYVYYVTNWGVLMWFLRHGYHVRFPGVAKVDHTERCRSAWKAKLLEAARACRMTGIVKLITAFTRINPLCHGIVLAAQKRT